MKHCVQFECLTTQLYWLTFNSSLADFMAKGIKTVMLKEIVLVLLKEGSMDRYMGPGLGLR